MLDTEFKNFNHQLPEGSSILSSGQNIIDGYQPDISITDSNNKVYLILECENKSDRKAFIGALVKASHFAYDYEDSITLIFVMNETGTQTTVTQVSSNIEPHFRWLYKLGATQLNRVCFLSHSSYKESADNNEALLSDEFMSRCVVFEG